jgi:hypothetical protein
MGAKRGRGRGSFIDSVLDAIDSFYGDVMQYIKAWAAAPPRLREVPEQPPVSPSLASTALSSQDGTETAPQPDIQAPSGESGQSPELDGAAAADAADRAADA